jgi:hypothetical protein
MVRVLYFTIIQQWDGTQNGGSLNSRTNILHLQRDDNIELSVVVAASEDARAATESFLKGHGVDRFLFVPLQSIHPSGSLRDYLKYRWVRKVGFPFEVVAARNPNVKQRSRKR